MLIVADMGCTPPTAAFPDYTPASQTPFKLYRAPMPGSATEDEGTLRDRLLLAGETDTMEYVSGNWDAGPGSSQELRRERRGYAGE